MTPNGRTPPFILLSLCVGISLVSHGSAAPDMLYTYCPNTTLIPASNLAIRSNIDALLSALSAAANHSTSPDFNYRNSTSNSTTVYGLYLCRGDDDPTTCMECVAAASTYLSQNCPRGMVAVIWYDECMVRYSNSSFFGTLEADFSLLMWNQQNVTGNATEFKQVLSTTLAKVAEVAAGNTLKFDTEQSDFNDFQSVYALGQCTPDLSTSDCNLCLQHCISSMPTGNKQGGRVLFFSCNLRYELYLFYQEEQNFMAKYCPDTTLLVSVGSSDIYRSNMKVLLSNLSSAANQTTNLYSYQTTATPSTNTGGFVLYGFYLCRGDVNPATCRSCVVTASTTLSQLCPYSKQAVIWYDMCMIRYSNESFFGVLDANSRPLTSNMQNVSQSTNDFEMGSVLGDAIGKVEKLVATPYKDGMMFGTANESVTDTDSKTVYVLGQCTPDIHPADCQLCLQDCYNFLLSNDSHQQGASVFFYNCNLRYEMYLFYSPTLPPGPSGSPTPGDFTPKQIAIISCSVIAVTMLFLSLALWLFVSKRKLKAHSTADLDDIVTPDSLQMDFNTIQGATHNFAIDRKLGQGGFGSVYKGTLENGQDVAVKRLSNNSGQGIVEFKTEVLLVAKLQHRNLVKLLGYCVSGLEKILVYEFLPNSSLDKILFDPTHRMSLNWETRFKIICGIAKGLMYLHEDSRLRVVHRDLKSSNILLDEAMNPKISDFGLAKLFGVDQTQDVTDSIAGTYGYMAPEYILMGHYSIKSDVYSFGIIVLEVVSGHRNKYINRPLLEEALLYRAWRFWHEGEPLKLVDETLGDNYSREDVLKCIHIGLLCIQENVAKRPNMTSIVAVLGGQSSITLPLPSPPNFFSSSNPTSTNNTNTSGASSGQGVSINDTSEITDLHGR